MRDLGPGPGLIPPQRGSLKMPLICRALIPPDHLPPLHTCHMHLSKWHLLSPTTRSLTKPTARPASLGKYTLSSLLISPSFSPISSGTLWGLDSPCVSHRVISEKTRILSLPPQSPQRHPLGTQDKLVDSLCCRPVLPPPATRVLLILGHTKLFPPQGLCTCHSTARDTLTPDLH